MKTTTQPYNPFDHLLTDDEIGEYLTNAFLDDDPAVFIVALGHLVKHKGVAEIAEQTGLNRESLYKVLAGTNQPRWDTVQRLMKALGVQFKAVA